MTVHRIEPALHAGGDEGATAAFYRVGDHAVGGWICDPARPARRFVVEIRVDGESAALALAESFVPEVRQRLGGDGCHGFVVLLDPERMADATLVEAFVANEETPFGSIALARQGEPAPASTGRIAGELVWTGGLRVSGWVCDVATPPHPLSVQVLVDGEPTVETLPSRWRESRAGDVVPPGRFGFEACLPARFADGRVHTVRAMAAGVDLAGSPAVVLAHDVGFQGLAAELDPVDRTGHLLRTQFLDRLMPAAVPLAEFEAWAERFPVEPAAPSSQAIAVLVVGDEESPLEDTLESLRPQGHPAALAVAMAAREGVFAPESLAAALAEIRAGGADAVLVMEAGTRLDPHALGHFAAALDHPAGPGLAYADTIHPGAGGTRMPNFKPCFDWHRMLAQAYAADLFVVPAGLVEAAASEHPESIQALLLAVLRSCEAQGRPVAHVPQLLADVPLRDPAPRAVALAGAAATDSARRGAPREVAAAPSVLHPAVRLDWQAGVQPEAVSIVIPTRGLPDRLEACMASLLERTEGVTFEVIVLDNGSAERGTHGILERLEATGTRVVGASGPFNLAQLNNRGAMEARHPLLLFMHDDVEALDPAWLRIMALEAADPGVAAVGATLLWPSRIVQHGGMVLGPHFATALAFGDRMDGEGGYGEQLLVPRGQAAVSGACLLVRKADYLAVGGMDELAFPVGLGDVDLCLKLREAGRSVLVTPHARLLHRQAGSRLPSVGSREQGAQERREIAALRERWGHVLAADPFYNPNLGLDLHPFGSLATPPRDRSVRFNPWHCW